MSIFSLCQPLSQPSGLNLTPPPKKITDIEAVNVGDQAYVKVPGENLASVEKALSQGTVLKTKNLSDDGKTMELLVTEEMSASRGRRSIDFVSKDGMTEVTGDLIVRPSTRTRTENAGCPPRLQSPTIKLQSLDSWRNQPQSA